MSSKIRLSHLPNVSHASSPKRPTSSALQTPISNGTSNGTSTLPTTQSLRPSLRAFSTTPTPQARLIKRPQRPYQFTQLITLSDGSAFFQRTTSPLPIYKSVRDSRNTALWNPSNARIANVEEDEAGRLSAFRRRFGRGYDGSGGAATTIPTNAAGGDDGGNQTVGQVTADEGGETTADKSKSSVTKDDANTSAKDQQSSAAAESDSLDNLMDLITSYGSNKQGKAQSDAIKGGEVGSNKQGRVKPDAIKGGDVGKPRR